MMIVFNNNLQIYEFSVILTQLPNKYRLTKTAIMQKLQAASVW